MHVHKPIHTNNVNSHPPMHICPFLCHLSLDVTRMRKTHLREDGPPPGDHTVLMDRARLILIVGAGRGTLNCLRRQAELRSVGMHLLFPLPADTKPQMPDLLRMKLRTKALSPLSGFCQRTLSRQQEKARKRTQKATQEAAMQGNKGTERNTRCQGKGHPGGHCLGSCLFWEF